ncbi:TIGR02757 family protein [Psychroflexus sp. YR1-1]|uniref:TIGR02757 family protein n=1 Tax=Psychroflexus aurantiacus TaxID=2709310 RepID=A0A6B3R0V6_9FLAO|nr:TIGR02757 family protein [Psychroflexus aurantiacus]NEV94226.1 TIGR02757 family protein [Psychroflexus aurantiacus]
MVNLSKIQDLKPFLDEKVELYNQFKFIATDPISIPHKFQKKEDIEIVGFLIASIAWGNRKSILNNGEKLCKILQFEPYDFIMNHTERDLESCTGFVHRTFNADDLRYFIRALKFIYTQHEGLEAVFHKYQVEHSLQPAIHEFKSIFFQLDHEKRTEKHVSDPEKNSAAKRINMFLRWMVRKDPNGVDFGIWKRISPAVLSCPLDVHSGRIARELGLLKRSQNDAKAVKELDDNLRLLDSKDPVKYDFALFGLGAFESF